ncbi:pilus assembly protein PilM, partial [Patescibacteria group bacterium]|nr:pilus assembly protein PilM [Patescibacteria group bacterium]
MLDWLFGEKSNTYLGIDLGSSSIKIVELGRKDGRAFLVNYALAQTKSEAVFSVIDLKNEEIIKIIETLVDEAKISGRHANVSLPVEKTFSTVISLPAMPEKELAAAVSFEAQKYVPLPLDEVALDWTVISNTADQNTGTAD